MSVAAPTVAAMSNETPAPRKWAALTMESTRDEVLAAVAEADEIGRQVRSEIASGMSGTCGRRGVPSGVRRAHEDQAEEQRAAELLLERQAAAGEEDQSAVGDEPC
jgi:hypothetical protein